MDSRARFLADFEPEDLAPEGPGWQQRKSAQTRAGILEAAIDCLALHGYARTTTQMIAEAAGVSRGAMLHHYPTKSDLIRSIIAYSFYKRSVMMVEGVKRISESSRVEEFSGLRILWDSFSTRDFKAYLELNIASRTDAEVREVFIPQARRFGQAWREEGGELFPEWAGFPERLSLANDLVESIMEGLALNVEVWDAPDRVDRMIEFLKRVVAKIFIGEFDSASSDTQASPKRRGAARKPA